jgi:histidinol phosphatase-like enzyme (inositol monophosphatase family)
VTTEGLRDLLEFAVEVAWRAGRATLGHFQTGVAAETKPDRTPVTVADRAAEMIARDLIRARHPSDGIVGEEMGDERPGAERRWILDPIDGTRSFVRGVPLYGVLLALEEEGEPVVGVAHFPALQETVYAARGLGCWWNGRRAIVSDVTRLDEALALTSDAEHASGSERGPGWDRLRARVGMVRTWGDCYGYALVATGRAEAMLDATLSVWDAAAVRPLVEEAGGVVTDWDGAADHRNGSLVATNAALAREIRDILTG